MRIIDQLCSGDVDYGEVMCVFYAKVALAGQFEPLRVKLAVGGSLNLGDRAI